MSERREVLLAAWLDGALGEPERAELAETLRTDPALARAAAEELELHRLLRFTAAQSEAGDRRAADRILHYVRARGEDSRFAELVRRRATARRPARPLLPWIFAAAALALAAAGVALVAGRPPKTPPVAPRAPEEVVRSPELPPPVEVPKPDDDRRRDAIEAEIRRAIAEARARNLPAPEAPKPEPPPEEKPAPAVEAKPAPPTRVAALARLLPAGTELVSGQRVEGEGLSIRFEDGTQVDLSGAAVLHEALVGRKSTGPGVALQSGRLAARVAKQPRPFLVTTSRAEIQVLGTAFTVEEDRVDVQEGQVRVVVLKSGQAATLAAGQGVEIPATGALRPHRLGLKATYYDRNDLKIPAFVRDEPGISLAVDAGKNEPAPVGVDRNFGVRWEGRFLAEREGETLFTLAVDGHVRFVLDGQELFADEPGLFHGLNTIRVRRRLAAGWHDLLLEYRDDSGSARCVLTLGDGGAPIPARLLTQRR